MYGGNTKTLDSSSSLESKIKSIVPHPQVIKLGVRNSLLSIQPVFLFQAKYSQFLYNNDVVLVELSSPLTLSPNVSAICLPEGDIQPRQLCVTAGWGVSSPGGEIVVIIYDV